MLGFISKHLNLVVMSEVLQRFFPTESKLRQSFATGIACPPSIIV